MVLLDMIMQIDRGVEVFYLDTDFLFPETYRLRDVAAAKYGFEPVGYMSLLTPSAAGAEARRRALGARPRRLLRDPQGRAERARARRQARLDQRHPPRPVEDARRHRHRRVGREVRPGEDQPARRRGRSRRSGSTSSTTPSRTTSCTTTTTPASAARTARSPSTPAKTRAAAAGRASTRPSAASTSPEGQTGDSLNVVEARSRAEISAAARATLRVGTRAAVSRAVHA